MSNDALMHVIALLLEDAKRLQKLEPNAGTEARIYLAQKTVQPVSTDAEYTSKKSEITPLKCDGINRVYHETMVKALRMEINKLQDIIHNHHLTSP